MKQYHSINKLVHKDGYIFIIIIAVVSFLLASINTSLGWIGFILTALCIYFFRNPDRVTPVDENLVISPADGVIQSITETPPPPELNMKEEKMTKISIFLSVLNVHVNRVPATGKIIALSYNPGKFINASLDKASEYNERQSVLMETQSGEKIVFCQIAGIVARRIICDLEENLDVKAGQRYGIIRFGSRLDVYLSTTVIPLVSEGQTVVGGETILANFKSNLVSSPKCEIMR